MSPARSAQAHASPDGKAVLVPAPAASAAGASHAGAHAPCRSAAASFEACGFPTAATTGWASAGTRSLTKLSSPAPTGAGSSYTTNITTDGAVISGVDMTGAFDVFADNVTIKNCRITTKNWWGINQRSGHSGLKVVNCTIAGVPGRGLDNGGETYGISNSGGAMEAAHNDISGFAEGISSGTGYFHDNYIHDLQSYVPQGSSQPAHTNALISSGGSGLRVMHNTLLNWMPPTAGGSGSLGLFNDGDAVTNVTVSGNWIAGGGYCVYPGGGSSSSNVVITGNYFSTQFFGGCGYYGADATTYWHTGGGNIWQGNVWANGRHAGRPVAP
jgi:hypothetical protein